MDKKISIFYTLCGSSKKDARSLAKKLLKFDQALCVNIINNVESLYLENKKVKSAKEIILIIKSMSSQKKIFKFIKEHHNYDIPFITKIKNESVNEDYLIWAKSLNNK